MVNLRKRDRLMSLLCVCTMVLYSAGCSTPSVLKSVTDPDYQPTYNDGLLIGSALWGGEAAYGLLGGYLVGDFLYHSLSGASPSSDGSMQFLEGYPRQMEAQYLARLDETRQVIPAPLGDGIPGDTTNWDNALYYAIRPEARSVRAENFDPSTYAVDLDMGTVEILETAYEAEPFTGTVIVNHPNNGGYRLIAYVNRGVMAETGSLWDLNGTKQLRHKYDENGTLRESGNFDVNGTLRLTNIFDENGTLSEDRVYFGNGITVRRQNTFAEDGTLTSSHYFDKNGERNLHKEGLILASDVRVKIVRLNLYPNPTEDSVPKLYDRHELDREIPGDASTYAFAINGTVVEFYDNEYKIKKRQEEIKDGLYDGTSIWWYSNGKKQFEAEFLGGVPQGITKWYHMNGSVEYEGEWQDNKLVRATTWTDSDQQNGQVLDGNGELIYLHPNGEKRLWEKYEMGKLTVTKWWDENGNPVESAETKFIPYYRRRIK